MTLPICEKLSRTTYIFCTGTSRHELVNPDGPEAVAVIETLVEALTEARVSLDRAQRVTFELAGYGENETDAAMADFVTANPAFRKIDAALSHLQKRRATDDEK